MLIALAFVLGIANFAANKAVLESGHPMLEQLPAAFRRGTVPLIAEFVVLLLALLMIANDWTGAMWVYGAYSLITLGSAWAMLTDRI